MALKTLNTSTGPSTDDTFSANKTGSISSTGKLRLGGLSYFVPAFGDGNTGQAIVGASVYPSRTERRQVIGAATMLGFAACLACSWNRG